MAAVAASMAFVLERVIAGALVACLAGYVVLSGLLLPRAFVAFESFFKKLGGWVGVGLTYMLLVPFFYLCFVPARAMIRICGKDPLKLKFPSDETSCWSPRAPVSAERMERQF